MNYVRAVADFIIQSANVRVLYVQVQCSWLSTECFSHILSYRQNRTSNLVKTVKISMRLSVK